MKKRKTERKKVKAVLLQLNSVAHRWRHENLAPGVSQTSKPVNGFLVWERRMKQRRAKTLQLDTQRFISQFDGLSSSKCTRHVPWNNKNKEFDGWRQNMIGFSLRYALLTSMAEKNIIIVPDIPVHHPRENQQASQRNTWWRNKRRSDPIRCLAVMKLASSVFAHKKTVLACAI